MAFAELKPDLDEQLAALAAKGMSSSQIARELGITRNAVIGRCSRRGFQLLGRSGRQFAAPSTTQPKLRSPQICQPKPASASPSRTRRAPSQKVAPLSKKLLAAFKTPEQREWPTVDILGLTSTTCRWPIGDDPRSPDLMYCGAPKEIGPYCAAHAAVAFTPRGLEKVRKGASFGRWC